MASKGLIGLIKRGWHEIPDVMASGALGTASVIFLGVYMYRQRANGEIYKNNMFRYNYTVRRSEDVPDLEQRPEMYN